MYVASKLKLPVSSGLSGNVEYVQVSARANVGSLRAWCEGLLCGCRWAAG